MDKLLLIDDEADMHYSFRRIFDSPNLELATASSGEEGLRLLPRFKPDLVLLDIRMGGMNGLETLKRIRLADARLPVIMMTAFGTTQTAIEAMKLGAYDYLLKPFDVPKLKDIVGRALKASHAMREVVAFKPMLDASDYELGIVGRSEPMQEVFKLIGQVAGSDATVLITGESGTGKELVARAIYQNSQRSNQAFVAINCAAIPENLLESELFGHEKGAFTGATTQRVGRFEQCHKGSIFLDEIGDMSLATQTKILRVLQSGTFERVGGNETIQAEVRIIAATNQDLEGAVAGRQFREDLFYRLNVVRIAMPPLRERAGDVRLLVNYFLKRFAQERREEPKAVSTEVLSTLESYHWPGNVRELENTVCRATVVAKGDTLLLADLPKELGSGPAPPKAIPGIEPAPPPPPPDTSTLASSVPAQQATEESAPPSSGVGLPELVTQLFQWAKDNSDLKLIPAVERELVLNALKETRGNQVQAARLLGVTRATLRKRMEKFGIRSELKFQ